MRKKYKAILGIGLILLFAGFVAILSSPTSATRYFDDKGIENGVDYSVSIQNGLLAENQSLSRFYRVNESLSILFNHNLTGSAVPTDVPVDFLVFSPSGKLTNLTQWMGVNTNPSPSGSTPFIVVVSGLDVWQVDGLIHDNSSFPKFIGKATEEGNYTLVYKLGSPWTAIRSMALSKTSVTVEYPFAGMLTVGYVLFAAGVVFCSVAVVLSKRRPQRRSRLNKERRV